MHFIVCQKHIGISCEIINSKLSPFGFQFIHTEISRLNLQKDDKIGKREHRVPSQFLAKFYSLITCTDFVEFPSMEKLEGES